MVAEVSSFRRGVPPANNTLKLGVQSKHFYQRVTRLTQATVSEVYSITKLKAPDRQNRKMKLNLEKQEILFQVKESLISLLTYLLTYFLSFFCYFLRIVLKMKTMPS